MSSSLDVSGISWERQNDAHSVENNDPCIVGRGSRAVCINYSYCSGSFARMKVCLTTTTWRETGGTHYYGKLWEYDSDRDLGTVRTVQVHAPLTESQAAVLNALDDMVGKSYSYEVGEPSERFDDIQSMKEAAIRTAREKWGEDVEIYMGNPAKALEDMERLI